MKYGKFASFEAFIDSYNLQDNQKKAFEISSLSREEQLVFIQSIKNKDVVEVISISKKHNPDEPGAGGEIHYQIIVELTEIKSTYPDIEADMNRCLQDKAPVFVAVRYGDKMGISQPIQQGLDEGNVLHIKGVWIPEDKAYSHGGEKMSVLHFTHHPVGFICTPEKCYQ